MKVVFTDEALADIEAIISYIAQDNLQRGLSFGDELVRAGELIADVPEGFALLTRYAHLGIRRKPYRNYSLFYWVREKRVVILHVLNSAQDYDSVFSEREES